MGDKLPEGAPPPSQVVPLEDKEGVTGYYTYTTKGEQLFQQAKEQTLGAAEAGEEAAAKYNPAKIRRSIAKMEQEFPIKLQQHNQMVQEKIKVEAEAGSVYKPPQTYTNEELDIDTGLVYRQTYAWQKDPKTGEYKYMPMEGPLGQPRVIRVAATDTDKQRLTKEYTRLQEQYAKVSEFSYEDVMATSIMEQLKRSVPELAREIERRGELDERSRNQLTQWYQQRMSDIESALGIGSSVYSGVDPGSVDWGVSGTQEPKPTVQWNVNEEGITYNP
jgi:hypothetical protein